MNSIRHTIRIRATLNKIFKKKLMAKSLYYFIEQAVYVFSSLKEQATENTVLILPLSPQQASPFHLLCLFSPSLPEEGVKLCSTSYIEGVLASLEPRRTMQLNKRITKCTSFGQRKGLWKSDVIVAERNNRIFVEQN